MQIEKYVFPSFVLVFCIHESVSNFSTSNPYSRKTVLVHLLAMFGDTEWRKLQELEPTEDKTISPFGNPYVHAHFFPLIKHIHDHRLQV